LEGQNTFLGGNDFCFYHIFKTNVLGTRKFGVAQKKFGGAPPPNAPRGYGPESDVNKTDPSGNVD